MDGVVPGLAVRAGEPPRGWHRCEEVIASMRDGEGTAARWRRSIAARLDQRHRMRVAPRVAAALQLGWLCDIPAQAAGLAYALARRVPAAGPADLAFRLDPTDLYPTAIALRSNAFSCLPDDPAAGAAGERVVGSMDALAQVVRDEVGGHGRALLALDVPGVRMGSRQRWGALTDSLEMALWTAGRARAGVELGAADAERVLGRPGDAVRTPFTSTATVGRLQDDRGRVMWTRRRTSCCFLFAVPHLPVCFACPRLDDTERRERMSSWVELPEG